MAVCRVMFGVGSWRTALSSLEAERDVGGQVSCFTSGFGAARAADAYPDATANSGAWFLATSKEHDLQNNHVIVDDGYNLGRDYASPPCLRTRAHRVVADACPRSPTRPMQIVETAIAGTRYRARTWTASVEWVEGLLPPGSEGQSRVTSGD